MAARQALEPVVLKRGPMTVITKTEALTIIRRAYGPLYAESVADRLPDRIDLDSEADNQRLLELGLTRGGLISALGGEL